MVENLKARSSSIALFTIDLLGIPDLSDNVFGFFLHQFLIYLVPQYLLIFYLNSVIFFPLFYIKVSLQTFLFIFANKRYSFHNCLFLILN